MMRGFTIVFFLFILLPPANRLVVTHVEAQENQDNSVRREVRIEKNGRILIDGKLSKAAKIDIATDKYVFRYKILDKPGQYLNQVALTVQLPTNIRIENTKPTVYAIHGVGDYHYRLAADNSLLFQANDIQPEASLTLTLDLPAQSLLLNPWQQFILAVDNLTIRQWLVISVSLPLAIVLFSVTIFFRRRKDILLPPAPVAVQKPPSALRPALVGALIHGYVSMKEIAATIIDLAERGYIDIVYKGDDQFGFSQRKHWQSDGSLQPFERLFLSQLFGEPLVSDQTFISQKLNRHVWSNAVSQSIDAIYATMVELGYFTQNPKEAHLSIRFLGIVLFFFSALGLSASLIFFTSQPFAAAPWLMSLIASPIILQSALIVPPRTEAGQAQAAQWLAFGRFLATPQSVGASHIDLFGRYLGYAIVLSVEGEWTRRFVDLPCLIPEWFYSERTFISSYNQLAATLFRIVAFVGDRFSAARKPTTI